jgi:hypothetical protein
MPREKYIERIGVIVDVADDGTVTRSPIERGNVRDTGFTLRVVLTGGAKERPERLLRKHTDGWKGFRMFGHSRENGRTWVTVHCAAFLIDRVCEFSFVEKIVQWERAAHGASQGHLRR